MRRLRGLGVDPILSWAIGILIGGVALILAGRWIAPNPE